MMAKHAALLNPNMVVVEQAIRNIQVSGGNEPAAIRRATHMKNHIREHGGTVDDWVNAVAVLVSWERGELSEVQGNDVQANH